MKKNQSSIIILGLETSCDETAVAVVEARDENIRVLSSVVSSQAKLHAKWGGVVPNLAAREHLKNIIPVLELGLKEAQVKPVNIDLITVTQGPGLIPALLIGVNAAKTLAYVWEKPLLGIHHIEGHIYANFINKVREISNSRFLISKQTSSPNNPNIKIKFPVLCLVVSGGHTQLVLMKKHLDYEIVGETLDDAAGEAFDKVARILDLGYPGGPIVSKMASENKNKMPEIKINLPRPMINSANLNFSFSGLKTAVLYETKKYQNSTSVIKKAESWKNFVNKMCHEFQQAAIDVLIAKTLKAAKIYQPKTIMLAGGVAANQELRQQLGDKIKKEFSKALYLIPEISYSIDNAAMIGAAAAFRWKNMSASQKKKALANWKTLQPDANLKLS